MASIIGHCICKNQHRNEQHRTDFPRNFPKISHLWWKTTLLKQCFSNSLVDGVYESRKTILILRLDDISNKDIFMPKKFLKQTLFVR